MIKQDGTPFWVRLLATTAQSPAYDQGSATEGAPVYRTVFSDITELKAAEDQKELLEAQLRQAEKREALGVLTGGFAHDVNNLIAVIVGNANLGNIAVEPNTKVAHYFENIEKASMRISNLTQQMQAYAGRVEIEMAEMDPDIVVREFIQLFSVSVPRNMTLRCELADRLPFLMGDSTQIFHVLMSLVTNAFEAIPEDVEGEVVLRTRAESVDKHTVEAGYWPLPVSPGHFATIEVTDTGVGMATEILALACDPFFSTKFTGRGLGLAAVIGILSSHGGGIRVQSELGRGSSFKIFLPAMPGARKAPIRKSTSTWRGEGRLLVVDDEQAVRSVARQMAERLGFSVVEAWSGVEAIEIFRLHHDEFTLVLLDLGMPRMTGREAFRVMRKIDGSIPMVLSSGYDVRESDMQIEGLAGFLKKPYRIAEFQGMLQRTLARPAYG